MVVKLLSKKWNVICNFTCSTKQIRYPKAKIIFYKQLTLLLLPTLMLYLFVILVFTTDWYNSQIDVQELEKGKERAEITDNS